MQAKVIAAQKRVLAGEEDPDTLNTAADLASTCAR